MCGICGYAGYGRDEALLRRMAARLVHRGPDDEGFLLAGTIGLGMRRLSIVDLAGGRQPLRSEDGRVAAVVNGEIYNHAELRRRLEQRGHRFATGSDAEVVVHLYEEHGLSGLEQLRGMFAFALCDGHRGSLLLVRDRLGIKPLYYACRGGRLLFASELKALLESPDVARTPHLPAVDAYLGLRYVPGPETLIAGVRRLAAGHWLEWRGGELRGGAYWTPPLAGGPYPPDEVCHQRFAELLTEAVAIRRMGEVPLGAYLSGGLDSGTIVAALAAASAEPVRTFAVGFGWKGDELAAARETAAALGCDHQEVRCAPEDLALLPEIVWALDEPQGDAIVVPTYLLARESARRVTIVLTGDGADETMAGYLFHRVLKLVDLYRRVVPGGVHRGVVTPLARRAPVALLNALFDYPAYLGAAGKRKLVTFLEGLDHFDLEASYRFLISLLDAGDKAQLYTPELAAAVAVPGASGASLEVPSPEVPATSGPTSGDVPFLERLLHLQYRHWLPDNILLRQDKLSMAHALELRVPFLDHKLVEFLHTMPPHLKLHGLTGKYLLRRFAARQVSAAHARRRKKPFYIPAEEYVGHPVFRQLLGDTLSAERVRRRGLFQPARVAELIARLDRRDFLTFKQVLALVILELWFQVFIDRTLQPTLPVADRGPRREALVMEGVDGG